MSLVYEYLYPDILVFCLSCDLAIGVSDTFLNSNKTGFYFIISGTSRKNDFSL